jgi:hypothetical protein
MVLELTGIGLLRKSGTRSIPWVCGKCQKMPVMIQERADVGELQAGPNSNNLGFRVSVGQLVKPAQSVPKVLYLGELN